VPEVGVRELKSRASEIVRDVRDRKARYTVTYRGHPVGVLLPIGEAPNALDADEGVWDELMRLGAEIGAGWQSTQTSTEILSDLRR
jgi:prevent-host-death family protein